MKQKVFTVLIAISLMLSSSVCMFGFANVAAQTIDEANQCFLGCFENATEETTFTRTPLYDEQLKQNGWQYIFCDGDINGYALLTKIVVNGQSAYEVQELKYGAISPFDTCEGLPIYVSHKKYLYYKDGAFFDILTNKRVSEKDMSYYIAIGFRYSGGIDSDLYEVNQNIYYATKSSEEYSIQYDLPSYQGEAGKTNCANIAGAVALGYYDRFFENLIPNYSTYIKIGAIFRYRTTNENILKVVNALYNLMGTDADGLGTTFTGFQNGMQAYVQGKGYSYSTQDMFSSGFLDISKYKSAVKSGKPVALFLSDYAIVESINTYNGYDIISNTCCDIAHVATACGYKIDTYYDSNGKVIDTRTYLKVSVGSQNLVKDVAYLNLNSLSTLNKAIAMTIQ